MPHKAKIIAIIFTGILCLVALGGFLYLMQTGLSIDSQAADLEKKLEQINELLVSAEQTASETQANYDGIYQAKAKALAYMVQHATDDGLDMRRYNEVLNTTNALILDRTGNALASAQPSRTDFTRARYNQLRTVFSSNIPSEAFEVEEDGVSLRYYGARIDSQRMVVIEQDPAELTQLMNDTNTWQSVLSQVSVGLEGYAFAISNRDYTFLYHPNEALVGTDVMVSDIDVSQLRDGNFTSMNLDGHSLYCGITMVDDVYVICALPETEMFFSNNITVGVVLLVFFIVIAIIILYAILMLVNDTATSVDKEKAYKNIGILRYNRAVGRKVGVFSVIGILCIFVISFYIQTLFAMSRWSITSAQHVADAERTNQQYQQDVTLLTNRYNHSYLSKCRTAAYILENHPELANRQDLAELSQVLDVENIFVYDAEGQLTATDSGYTNFHISSDPTAQSYAFHPLLQGVDSVVQAAGPDEISGDYKQYVGVTMRMADGGGCAGVVQIAVKPEQLEQAVKNLDLAHMLSGIRIGTDGFAFAVNKEDLTFAYFPQKKYIGRNAIDSGMQDNQFADGYSDYITLNSGSYYGSAFETDDAYVYLVVPAVELGERRLEISLASTGCSLVCLLIIFCIITLSPRHTQQRKQHADKDKDNAQMVDVMMPDGSVKKTTAASVRWGSVGIKWGNQTPEQQVSNVLRGLLGLMAIIVCLSLLFKDTAFSAHSVLTYVLSGKWQKGLNVFAFTACLMALCALCVITMIVQKVLKLFSRVLEAHGVTICRLLSSFVKYISVLGGLFYCLSLLGVDTQTLLASASILTLVIGLGANKLVADIIAGLFIIFEGDFRVGDIVTVGDWRGTVLEIGVRTTKLESADSNIKILNNSAISGVVNMTRKYSVASVDLNLQYTEPLEELERMLKRELPHLRDKLPAIKEGPYYDGILAIGGGKMGIRIVAHCSELDRTQLLRDLNREVKLLFDRHEIKIL